jgi:hypothetical protein
MAHLVIDNAALDEMLKGPGGPVNRAIIKKVDRYQAACRAQVARKSKTGCLEGSILKRILPNGGVLVISDTAPCSPDHQSYSLFVHEGTSSHTIRPKKASMLSFVWPGGPQGNKRYFFFEVHHPGTKPDRFLTDNVAVLAT